MLSHGQREGEDDVVGAERLWVILGGVAALCEPRSDHVGVSSKTRVAASGENQTEDSALNGRNLRSTFDPMGSIRLILSTR
jgi:hypothetical protein